MSFLYYLEDLRTPLLDNFFSFITHFGEETLFIVLGLVFFWCINKKEGYYLLSIGFVGTIINQFLKLFFRIPRPWVLDEDFTIVESARANATGYSFPSGHTQNSVGVFGGIARWHKRKWVRVCSIILCILIPFSRMYLGVHTPLDVLVSVIISATLIFVFYPIIKKSLDNSNVLRILLITITALSALYLIYVSFYSFPADIDKENLREGTKNAYKLIGCTVGVWISFEVDERFIKFNTDGSLLTQLFKLVLGIIPVLAIKEGLKSPLAALFYGSYFAYTVRYLLLLLFVGCVWPLTFKWFNKKFSNK